MKPQLYKITDFTLDEIKREVILLKENEIYRVSDCLNDAKIVVRGILSSNDGFKGTILYDYLMKKNENPNTSSQISKKNIKNSSECFSLFRDTVISHCNSKGYILPDPDHLVIHIRSGDNFKCTGLGSDTIKSKLMTDVLNILKTEKIKGIVLVTAFHYGVAENSKLYGDNHEYSFQHDNYNNNLECLLSFINELRTYADTSIFVFSNSNIDLDLCYLFRAKHLLTTQGGFAEIITRLKMSA